MPDNRNKGKINKNIDYDALLNSEISDENEIIIEDEEVFVSKTKTPHPVTKKENIPVKNQKKSPDEKEEKSSFWKRLSKLNKALIIISSFFLSITIFLVSALAIFINNKFNMLGDMEEFHNEAMNLPEEEKVVEYEDEIPDEEELKNIDGAVNTANFKEALKNWATNGNENIMSSKDVINVLLIGADTNTSKFIGNTDVMMIVSLNKKTKKIKLVSVMRDSYLYIEGKNSSYCTKLNAAFSMGGPDILMKTIENNLKIKLDGFVMVNFESFKAIIDAMGGVTVDVKKYEANYASGPYKTPMPYGDNVTLNGEQALMFCRIRGCDADGDVSRTRRQRMVINSMINRVKSSSVSELNKYLNVLLPYVYTGFEKKEILSLGVQAITSGWASYEISDLQIPTPETRTSGNMGFWIWVVDYQLAAQILQKELYGKTNIILEEDRTTLIDVYRGRN